MTTGIIIQTRMSSTRLPGKVMLPLAGKPMLWHVVMRSKQSRLAERVIVATSTDPSDDPIETWCKQNAVDCFRGSLNDVLDRFYQCAVAFKLTAIVRITSDCPLVDQGIIDQGIKKLNDHSIDIDYVSNVLNRTFPRGLDCEIFTLAALSEADAHATSTDEREHVTPWIVAHTKTLVLDVDPSFYGHFRLTVDEQADYDLMTQLYDRFYQENQLLDTKEIIAYLNQHPESVSNQHIEQKYSIH